jgi:hypothetical protein
MSKVLCIAVVALAVISMIESKDEAQRIMEDFSGYGDQVRPEDLQVTHRDLKSGVLLSDIKDGKVDGFGSKKDLVTGGFHSAQQVVKGGPEGFLNYKKNVAESTYDNSRKVVSRIANLLGIPLSEDPLQDALDAGIAASAAGAVVTADFSQVMSSNLDSLLYGHKKMKDAYANSQAEIYKAVLRNILLIKQGLGVLSQEVESVTDDMCDPAEFVPPQRKRAEYRGPGLKLTFKTGECALDFQNEFLDWDFKLFCNKPSLTYVKTPPVFISEHTTPAEFKTRECKEEKLNYGEVEAVLHTFDGSALLNPSAMSNLLLSNTFPRNTQVLRGSIEGLGRNDTATNILGSLLDWNPKLLDLGNKKKWDLMSVGSNKNLLGAKNDLSGSFTSKVFQRPDWLKKGLLA